MAAIICTGKVTVTATAQSLKTLLTAGTRFPSVFGNTAASKFTVGPMTLMGATANSVNIFWSADSTATADDASCGGFIIPGGATWLDPRSDVDLDKFYVVAASNSVLYFTGYGA